MADIEVRSGRFAELDGRAVYDLARLRQEVFVVEQECAYPDLDDADLDPATVHFWIDGRQRTSTAPQAFAEGGAAACLRVLRGDGEWKIGRVCSALSARGSGLSAALMRAALEFLGPEVDVVLGAQTYAAGFYRKFGFAEYGEEYLEDDIPHVMMRRPKASR